MDTSQSEKSDEIEISLQKTYLTIMNYVQIASPELYEDMPQLKDVKPEHDIIQLMSQAYLKMSIMLQAEQEGLVKEEEKAQFEMEDLRNYSDEINIRLKELVAHEKSLQDKYEEVQESEALLYDFSCYDQVLMNSIYTPYLSCINLKNPSEEDLANVRLLIENQLLELQERDLLEAQQDYEKEQLLDQILALEEKISRIEQGKASAGAKFRKLVEGLEEFENQQEISSLQKNSLKSDFLKLAKKNETNFNKYQELMRVERQMAIDEEQIENQMQQLRDENKTLDSGSVNVEDLKSGLAEQEQINIRLREKLSSLTSKIEQLKTEDKRTQRLFNNFTADLEKEGLDYELDNSFKIDVVVGNRKSTFQEKIGHNRSSQILAQERINENQRIIETLESEAEFLGQKLIEETNYQELILQDYLVSQGQSIVQKNLTQPHQSMSRLNQDPNQISQSNHEEPTSHKGRSEIYPASGDTQSLIQQLLTSSKCPRFQNHPPLETKIPKP